MNTTGSWIAYVGLIVSALAHFGWVVDPAAITTVIGGIVTLVGIIYSHYNTKTAIAAANAQGVKM